MANPLHLLSAFALLTLLACGGGEAPAPAAAPQPPDAPVEAPSAPAPLTCDPGETEVFSCTGANELPILVCIEQAASVFALTLSASGMRVSINLDGNEPDFGGKPMDGQDNKVLHFYDPKTSTNYDVQEINAHGEHYGALVIQGPNQGGESFTEVRCKALPRTNWAAVEGFRR